MKKNVFKFKALALITVLAVSCILFAFKRNPTGKHFGYSVIIKNHNWNSLHVQVRVGNKSNPESNPVYNNYTLGRDKDTGPIPYDIYCWYRRDAQPDHPDGVHFSNWTSTGCFNNTPCLVDNP